MRKTVQTTLRLPADTLDTLQAIADRAGCSIDVVVRVCLAREVVAVSSEKRTPARKRAQGDAK